MSFSIPDDLRSGLATLYPVRSDVEETMGAHVLHNWRTRFAQENPGITAPADKALTSTHLHFQQFSPLFPWRAQGLTALMFSDQSVLVTREADGILTALPAVFGLRSESRHCEYLPVIRSENNPEARISFRRHKKQTRLPAFKADEPGLMSREGASAALGALEADLARLVPLFQDLPHIHQPNGGAPIKAHGVLTLSWLPQCWYSDAEKQEVQRFAKDFADWIMSQAHEDIERATVILRTRKPEKFGQPHALLTPYEVHVKRRRGTAMFDLENMVEDPARLELPIPEDRLYSLDFRTDGTRRHSARPLPVLRGEAIKPPSRHRELALLSRFGALPKGVLA